MAAVIDHRSSLLSDILTSTIKSPKITYIFYATLLLGLLLKVYRSVINGYYDYLALGPGGTPSNFAGYLRVSYLRLFALKDPFQPPSLARACYPTTSYLRDLPQRSRPRPEVVGIAPQRQVNQRCSASLHNELRKAFHSLADAHPSMLKEGNSCFEKHGLALFLSACSLTPHPDSPLPSKPSHLNPTCANTGEICHLHASDSSMHLTLHPIDTALVIASGWGERHPLAGCHIHGKRLLPPGFVMVYTPQNAAEIRTVMEIVKAAGWWVGGVDLGCREEEGFD